MSLAILAGHTTYLAALAVAIILYYTVKATVLFLTFIMGIFTKDENRRAACLQLAETLCKGWPLPPRLPKGP